VLYQHCGAVQSIDWHWHALLEVVQLFTSYQSTNSELMFKADIHGRFPLDCWILNLCYLWTEWNLADVAGYGGVHCQLKYSSSDVQCQSSRCRNGGLCVASGANNSISNMTCVCPTGYTGHDCSIKVCRLHLRHTIHLAATLITSSLSDDVWIVVPCKLTP